MNAEFKQVKEIFLSALERETAEARETYLSEACAANQPLRRQVQALLERHEQAGSFLEVRPADEAPATFGQTITERPGTVIGPYKLLEQIGEGGFGVVFMAEQQQPLRRRVALKVIKPGMDTRQVIARFEAERQALALMDHPNIARVLDAGATEAGHPYFVMELVRGVPITDYCDRNQLTPKQRLELFVPVCQAVQHAHQKGIIHRDIKPTNVLVTLHDGTPVIKIIDFGIAKATGQQLTEKTLFTNFAQMIGTPLYMSPEQAEMSGLDIDTRSDIYSLGVLLYELLTGTTPFDKERLKTAAYDEIRRLIREEEPPKPSTRMSSLGETSAMVSANRKSEAHKLSQLFRGDLDWIAMKSLEKDRQRRYETACGLARDVERYLHDEPVEACPPSTVYRLGKFARRNKAMLTAAALVAATLLVGAGTSTWQWIRAEWNLVEVQRQRQRAEDHGADANRLRGVAETHLQEARRQQTQAEQNLAEAQRQRALAEGSYQQARGAVDDVFVKISEDLALSEPDFEPLRAELLQSALHYYREFIEIWKDEPAKRAELAASYRRVARLTEEIGALPEAVAANEKALELQLQLADQQNLPEMAGLAKTWNGLGQSQQKMGRHEAAARSFDQALALWQALLLKIPSDHQYRDGLADTYSNIAYLRSDLGNVKEGIHFQEQALALREQLVKEFPDIVQLKSKLARDFRSLAARRADDRQWDSALALLRKQLEMLEELSHGPRARTSLEAEIAMAHNRIGDIHRQNRRQPDWAEKALAAYNQAATTQKRLVLAHPANANLRSNYANTLHNLGAVYLRKKEHAEALRTLAEAIGHLERLVLANPTSVFDVSSLGATYADQARALESTERLDEAAAAFQHAIRHHQKLVKLAPAIERYRKELAEYEEGLNRVGQRVKQ